MTQSSSFYRRRGKRLFDTCLSLLGLLFLSPLLCLIGAAVRLSSPGSVFFWQERVGLSGKTFKICKFRTMNVGADRLGPGITSAGDQRITRIGRLLRRWKLDELPQLWNVLKGEMSLVGPRPELPYYVQNYTTVERRVLFVLPGITDPASLAYRNEEDILAKAADREQFYRQKLLPHKLALNLEYIESRSFRGDIGLILATLKVIPSRRMAIAKTFESLPEESSLSEGR
jgi:lipopolysaccharide/colanic/teichoic acid biosynthesis glycosyltransferase